MQQSATEPGATRPRGRPPRLSSDQIVDAGLELLRQEGPGSATTRALAERLGASRMALYGWFENKDVLLDAMASRLMELVPLDVSDAGTWRERFEAWLRGLHSGFRHAPELTTRLLGQGESARHVLVAMAHLVDALVVEGMARAVAARTVQAALWATVGFLLCETNMPSLSTFECSADADQADPHAAAVRDLLTHLSDGSDDAVFEIFLARIMDGVELALEGSERR